MKTVKTLVALSLLAVAGIASAADAKMAAINNMVNLTIASANDNGGLSLNLADEGGKVVVRSASKSAAAAGVQPGDVLKSVCTLPAGIEHVHDLATVAGGEPVYLTVVRAGNLVDASEAIRPDNLQATAAGLAIKQDVGELRAGDVIETACVPVHHAADYAAIVAPLAARKMGKEGLPVAGAFIAMNHQFSRNGDDIVVADLTPAAAR